MKKPQKTLLAALLISTTIFGANTSLAEKPEAYENKAAVQLTDEQKKEMSVLQKDILEKRKQVISKYVKYGVFSEEKGMKIISHLEQRYTKLEQNGFIPQWNHSHKKHKH